MLAVFLALGNASVVCAASLTVSLVEDGGKFVVTLNDLTATNSLWVAWDESDKGEQPGDWANAERIQTVTPETGPVEYPLPTGWGENIRTIRFFLSEVPYDYDYTLDFLRSGTTATDGTTTRRILLNDFGFNVKYRVEVRMREAKHNTSGTTYTASSEQNMSFIGGTQVLVDDSTFVGRTLIGINTNAVRLTGLRRTTAEFEFLPKDADRPTSLVFRATGRGGRC